ncbi:MAG: sodium/hydrogen exchanger [Bryobacteraceae bacterium]|nr:MAG: sodium/hydrogen exchanger [Bryobacteraceae bacterium]
MGIAADFVLIVVAGLVGAVAARLLRLPLLVGYIAAGVIVGPNTAGPTVQSIHDIELLAEIGVALLLFSLGLEISIRDMLAVRRVALIGGPIQILGCGAMGWLAGHRLFSMTSTEALWFGAMVAMSSTTVIVKLADERGVSRALATRVMVGMSVTQDLAVIPLLILLPQANLTSDAFQKILQSMAVAASILAAIVFLGMRFFPWLLRRVLRWGSREMFLVAVVAVSVGVGYAANLVGLSFAIGAFIAGLILSESEFSHQALSELAPLRDVFGLLFFVSVGMLFDPTLFLAQPWKVLGGVALIYLAKSVLIGLLARSFGYIYMAPWIIGLGLANIGEFSFVLARAGIRGGFISKETYDFVLICTILSIAVAPLVASLALPLGRWWRRRFPPPKNVRHFETPRELLRDHILVAGYGRTGRAVAGVLRAAGLPVVIIELNHAIFNDIRADGVPALWGDVTSEEILRAAGLKNARLLILTVPDGDVVRLATERARKLAPHVPVIARAARVQLLDELRRLGAASAVLPEFEAGMEMARQAMLRSGIDPGRAEEIILQIKEKYVGEGV